MAFYPEGQGFQALEKNKGAHGAYGRPRIPEQYRTGADYIGGRAYGIREYNPVIAGLRLRQLGEFS